MPLIPARPPKKCHEEASSAVRQLLIPPHSSGTMTAATAEEHELAAPHDVYTINADKVANGSLKSARRIGWRYLVMQGERAVAAAEVQRPAGTGQPEFSHLNSGPFVEGSIDALSIAESLAEVAADDFEVRLLKLPSVYVMALWLHGPSKDILIPLGPSDGHGPLTPNKPYSPDDFFRALTPLAQTRMAFDDSPRDSAGGVAPPRARAKKATKRKAAQPGPARPVKKPNGQSASRKKT